MRSTQDASSDGTPVDATQVGTAQAEEAPAAGQNVDEELRFQNDFYREDAEHIIATPFFLAVHRRTVRLLKRMGALEGQRVLSLGCGDGGIENMAAPGAASILGIDLSPEGIALARRGAEDASLDNVEYRTGDIQDLDVEPESCDVVWAIAVLHHFPSGPEVERILANGYSALRPGGLMVSIDPSAARLVNAFKSLVRRQVERCHTEDEGELAIDLLRDSYQKVGFMKMQAHYSDFAVGPLAWLVPGMPLPLARLALALDSLVLRVPGLRRWSSSFALIAEKPPEPALR